LSCSAIAGVVGASPALERDDIGLSRKGIPKTAHL
jgi:hypothetical protein